MDTRRVKNTQVSTTGKPDMHRTQHCLNHAQHTAGRWFASAFLKRADSCMQQRGDRQMRHLRLPSCKRWSMPDCIQSGQHLSIQCRQNLKNRTVLPNQQVPQGAAMRASTCETTHQNRYPPFPTTLLASPTRRGLPSVPRWDSSVHQYLLLAAMAIAAASKSC
jgi:hypothetical protein